MKRQQTFAFDLNDKVIIKEIQRPGSVEALTIDFLGVQYRVRYFDNSEFKTAWLREDELELR
jgi:hypothetical protein